MAQSVDVQVTEAEEQFLRGFFRRQVIPWFGGFAALTLVLSTLAFVVATNLAEPVLAPSPKEIGAARAALSDEAPAEWQEELAALRGELEAMNGGGPDLAKLREELSATTKAVEELRTRVARAEKAAKSSAGAASAGPALASGDLDSIRKRLASIEKEQDAIERRRAEFAKDALNRLFAVEESRDALEARMLRLEASGSSLPAAPRP